MFQRYCSTMCRYYRRNALIPFVSVRIRHLTIYVQTLSNGHASTHSFTFEQYISFEDIRTLRTSGSSPSATIRRSWDCLSKLYHVVRRRYHPSQKKKKKSGTGVYYMKMPRNFFWDGLIGTASSGPKKACFVVVFVLGTGRKWKRIPKHIGLQALGPETSGWVLLSYLAGWHSDPSKGRKQ